MRFGTDEFTFVGKRAMLVAKNPINANRNFTHIDKFIIDGENLNDDTVRFFFRVVDVDDIASQRYTDDVLFFRLSGSLVRINHACGYSTFKTLSLDEIFDGFFDGRENANLTSLLAVDGDDNFAGLDIYPIILLQATDEATLCKMALEESSNFLMLSSALIIPASSGKLYSWGFSDKQSSGVHYTEYFESLLSETQVDTKIINSVGATADIIAPFVRGSKKLFIKRLSEADETVGYFAFGQKKDQTINFDGYFAEKVSGSIAQALFRLERSSEKPAANPDIRDILDETERVISQNLLARAHFGKQISERLHIQLSPLPV